MLMAAFCLWASCAVIHASEEEDGAQIAIKDQIVQYLKARRVGQSDEKLRTIAHTVYEEAWQYDLDYRLVLAVMKVESNFRPDAVSTKGARGLLQIKPSLARHVSREIGVTIKGDSCLHEPEKNIKIGVNHLAWLVEKFEDLDTALHAYNVGPARSRATTSPGKTPATRFTKKVLREYEQIISVLPDAEAE